MFEINQGCDACDPYVIAYMCMRYIGPYYMYTVVRYIVRYMFVHNICTAVKLSIPFSVEVEGLGKGNDFAQILIKLRPCLPKTFFVFLGPPPWANTECSYLIIHKHFKLKTKYFL